VKRFNLRLQIFVDDTWVLEDLSVSATFITGKLESIYTVDKGRLISSAAKMNGTARFTSR